MLAHFPTFYCPKFRRKNFGTLSMPMTTNPFFFSAIYGSEINGLVVQRIDALIQLEYTFSGAVKPHRKSVHIWSFFKFTNKFV
jgi:hypothetical protein